MNIAKINNFRNTNFTSSKLDNNIKKTWRDRWKENPNELVSLTEEEKKTENIRLTVSIRNILKNLLLKNEPETSIKNDNNLKPHEYDILDKIETGSSPYLAEDYARLSPEGLTLARHLSKPAQNVVKQNLYYSELLKKHLDEHYGKGRYTFVSIGRSPSTIGRCLDSMAVPVIFCPMSGLRNEELKKFANTKCYHRYLAFLAGQGLTRQQINDSDKKLLLYDYTESGESLRSFRELLCRGLDIDGKKVQIRSINQDIENIAPNKFAANAFIAHTFSSFEAERYGGVPELPWEQAGSILKAKLTRPNQAGYNQFQFTMQDKKKELLI